MRGVRSKTLSVYLVISLLASVVPASSSFAQQTQIPPLQVCNAIKSVGRGVVEIKRRAVGGFTGSFDFLLSFECHAGTNWVPKGRLQIFNMSMDRMFPGPLETIGVEQLSGAGKDKSVTFASGLCRYRGGLCRYWIMLSDNRPAQDQTGTMDVFGFVMMTLKGDIIAHGAGPVIKGDISVGIP